jgi:hypothetical protein
VTPLQRLWAELRDLWRTSPLAEFITPPLCDCPVCVAERAPTNPTDPAAAERLAA